MNLRAIGCAALSALVACSNASGGTGDAAAAQPQTASPQPARLDRALIGMWSGESGPRCWAEVVEFRAAEMTFRGNGGSDLKTVKVSFKDAGPNKVQVVPETGSPVTYTMNDASHLTDGSGCLFQRTD